MSNGKLVITGDTSQAQRAIADLDKALDGLEKSSALATKALASITAVAGAVTYAILSTINAAGDLIDASDKLGISAANLQQLQQAALLAGVGADQLNMSIQRLSANIGEGLAKGTGGAVDALNKLGLPIKEIANLKPDEQFKRISEELLKIENPAQRTAASMELFGKQGPAILKVAEELKKVKDLTEATGFLVTERDLVALDEAADSVDQLRVLWDAGVKKAVADIAPYIVAIVNHIKQAIVNAGGFDAIWAKITSTIKTVVNIALLLATILVTRVAAGAVMVAVQLGRAALAARSLSIILARTPIGLLAAGAAILADKLGIDLVGSAGDFLDINLDTVGAQDQINKALDDRNIKLNAATVAVEEYNEEQQKALVALGESLTKLYTNVQYQKDINKYGEDEAEIRKAIKEEQEKLAKVGLTLTDQQEQLIRGGYTELSQQKDIAALRKEQATALKEALAPTSATAKEIEKMALLSMKFKENMTDKDIEQAMNDAREAANKLIQGSEGKPAWQLKQEKAINDSINAEINKYEQTIGWDKKYNEDKMALLQILAYEEQLGINLTKEQRKGLNEALLQLDIEMSNAREAARVASIDRINQAELTRIQQLMTAEEDLSKFILDENQKRTIRHVADNDKIKANVAARIEFEKKTDLEKTAFAIDQGAQMFSALGAQNKKAFEAAKAFNIANAIMNTYMAATKALATYPPPFNFIAAAAAIGMGLAQVAQIKSQSYSGRALGGPVMGGTPYLVGESGPELFTPNTTGSITRNGDLGGSTTNVNFTIVANDAQGFDDLLLQRRGLITQIISDSRLEQGMR